MKYHTGVLAVLFALLLAGCASKPPKPDPVREEVIVLQKQLLELQQLQKENSEAITGLSSKIRSLEERLAGTARRKAGSRSTSYVKKKRTAKKVRRQ